MSIVFLLQEVQLAENLGAVARAMGNFGFTELRLISPLVNPLSPEALAMSAGAGSILERAKIFDKIAEALQDLVWVYGTCATPRHLIKIYAPIGERAPQIVERSQQEKVGILMGPERTGLDNELLAQCHEILYVPTHSSFSSMNLAQAVVVIAYELSKVSYAGKVSKLTWETTPATQGETGHFLTFLERNLDEVNYWRVPCKKNLMWRYLKNLFTRLELTSQDLKTLRGVITRLRGKN